MIRTVFSEQVYVHQFEGESLPMKMAEVATIDLLLKSIVGFSKRHKCPRLPSNAQ